MEEQLERMLFGDMDTGEHAITLWEWNRLQPPPPEPKKEEAPKPPKKRKKKEKTPQEECGKCGKFFPTLNEVFSHPCPDPEPEQPVALPFSVASGMHEARAEKPTEWVLQCKKCKKNFFFTDEVLYLKVRTAFIEHKGICKKCRVQRGSFVNRTNTYATGCRKCGGHVPPGHGWLFRTSYGWETEHRPIEGDTPEL